MKEIDKKIAEVVSRYNASGVGRQVDYEKFYLYSLITHSTAIEGSTMTEVENQLLFDEGIAAKGRTLNEQMMNVDLKNAYVFGFDWADKRMPYTADVLRELSAKVMRRTGSKYSMLGGELDSSKGDFRLCNVSAGIGGNSYLAFTKVPKAVDDFCRWLNDALSSVQHDDTAACYRLSFEAHFRLVTIHPWVDGNGRTTRLLMNMVQRQTGQIPSIVAKEDKAQYIQALIDSREADDSTIMQDEMLRQHIENLERRILQYHKTAGDTVNETPNDTVKSATRADCLIDVIRNHPEFTYEQYAAALKVSRATIARAIKKLTAAGDIKRVGADKDGHWEVTEK